MDLQLNFLNLFELKKEFKKLNMINHNRRPP